MEFYLRIKLTGDGKRIRKHIHVVDIAFTFLNEGNKALAADGNHVIAVLKVKEDYDSMKTELRDIIKAVESLKTITYQDIEYQIDWYLGGDWKFLAMVCGIGSAISKYPCIWCKGRTDEKFDIEQNWSITDVDKGARTVQEILQLCSKRGTLDSKCSCKQPPFFPFIPLHKVVIDTLHLILRISDNLQNLLILELRNKMQLRKKLHSTHLIEMSTDIWQDMNNLSINAIFSFLGLLRRKQKN